jgi:hypothetical protein
MITPRMATGLVLFALAGGLLYFAWSGGGQMTTINALPNAPGSASDARH